MNFFEFPGVKVSALAVAVPDHEQNLMDLTADYPAGEVEKLCKTTGCWKRFISAGVGTTASDLCVAAAKEIFEKLQVDKSTIDGMIFLTQSPDYQVPPTSCVIQYRLGLDNCGLVYDSNLGCAAFPYGVQLAGAQIMSGCKRILLMVGDSFPERGCRGKEPKGSLFIGECGIAAIVEKTDTDVEPIRIALHTIGEGYKALMLPYGQYRHSWYNIGRERDLAAIIRDHSGVLSDGVSLVDFMEGADVFTFSITDVPKTAKAFLKEFGLNVSDFDLFSIHQANKMIIDNVVKRMKAPVEKVLLSIDRYGNTKGASTAINICDYAERTCDKETKRIFNLGFGIGLNIAIADFYMDMSRCLPIIRTREVFDDGITNYTYF